MSNPNIAMFDSSDPAMGEAHRQARESFKYFWRELSWEYRRIIPGLDVAAVKIAFGDGDTERDGPSHEHMWINEVTFDGSHIRGVLINEPEWVTNIAVGDAVTTTLDDISDWMFAIQGRVYGGFTVNLIRSRMPSAERRAHDEAWGLDFGDPKTIELVYEGPKKKSPSKFLGRKKEAAESAGISPLVEHPMSLNMQDSLREQLHESPEYLYEAGERGWTMLHTEALAGNLSSVQVLIELGADLSKRTDDGLTAIDAASILGWDHVIDYLGKKPNVRD